MNIQSLVNMRTGDIINQEDLSVTYEGALSKIRRHKLSIPGFSVKEQLGPNGKAQWKRVS